MSTKKPTGVAILGSTGSIGVSTLSVIRLHPEKFKVVALSAHSQVDRMVSQCQEFNPEFAVMADEMSATQLAEKLKIAAPDVKVLAETKALNTIAKLPQVEQVMAAIVGAAGLESTMAAASAGKRILLANKEALVVAGSLLIKSAEDNGAELLPIDSEHNALFQCLPSGKVDGGIKKLLLTGSGGPFLEASYAELEHVTPEQACNHPNWSMGRKISVDSATMMNKGLELIEACWLFGVDQNQIEVVLHPQSIIHSMVEYIDGSILAQLGNPDMRTPIAHAMAFPERVESGVSSLDLLRSTLDFSTPDLKRYPCLRLATEALTAGGDASIWMNAANEIAVAAFLNKQISFTQIAQLVEQAMLNSSIGFVATSIEDLLQVDKQAREFVLEQL